MLVAVQQNPLALEYASERLKAKREIVREAVYKNGSALEHASAALKASKQGLTQGGTLYCIQ